MGWYCLVPMDAWSPRMLVHIDTWSHGCWLHGCLVPWMLVPVDAWSSWVQGTHGCMFLMGAWSPLMLVPVDPVPHEFLVRMDVGPCGCWSLWMLVPMDAGPCGCWSP